MADLAQARDLNFPTLEPSQLTQLRSALGPKVALANPLDYHTYIWGDANAMGQTFTALFDADLALGLIVLDFPRPDRCSIDEWDPALRAIVATAKASKTPVAVLASLPDTLPEDIAKSLMAQGVIPLHGMAAALEAIALAETTPPAAAPVLLPRTPVNTATLSEYDAKCALQASGMNIPNAETATTPELAAKSAANLSAPYVLKGLGLAHKSEAGAVHISLMSTQAVEDAARNINCDTYLIEEMVQNATLELLIAVTLDPAHGYVLTLGAGGTMTELLQDTTSLILPVTQEQTTQALNTLCCAPRLDGYRGGAPADRAAIWQAIDALQRYVIAHHGAVLEVEINPLICTPNSAVAVDALIVKGDPA